MNATPLRRPLSCCLRAASRQPWARLASTATAAKQPVYYPLLDRSANVRSAFAVYAPPPKPAAHAVAPTPTPSAQPKTLPSQATSAPEPATAKSAKTPRVNVLQAYDQQQIRRMDPTGARTQLFSRKNPDAAKPGDVLLMTPSKAGAEGFAGVCIAIRRAGIETAVLLRGQLAKTSIEMWVKIYARSVGAIDIVERQPRRARRAKLTFMRHRSHDRGSVENLVKVWRRNRNALRSKHAPTKKTPAKKK